jgi:hypothetical protein
VGWQILKRQVRTCQACGFSSMGGDVCPACGTPYSADASGSPGGAAFPGAGGRSGSVEIDAREVIIGVQATDVSQGSKSGD